MRLDRELVIRGLARSRQNAQEAIRAGHILINGEPARRPSTLVTADDQLVCTQTDDFVSRAAHKLVAALAESGLEVPARAMDAGASTGGFTQVLLQAGAQTVFAVDVGHGQLVNTLRDDPRVQVREGLNLRDLTVADLDGEPVDLVVGDLSFISLKLVLEPIFAVLGLGGVALLLVKPQFEVGRAGLDDRGVVRDGARRERAIEEVIQSAAQLGWRAVWRADSVLPGQEGNVECFVQFSRAGI